MSLTAICIQARLNSERLPKKILADINGRTMLEQIVRRCNAVNIKGLSIKILVACPMEDELEIFARTGITPIPGPNRDVLTRLLKAAEAVGADHMVRVTGDCPLVCPRMIESMVNHAYSTGAKAVVNWKVRHFPNGFDLEVYDVAWLRNTISKELNLDKDREWFASHIINKYPDPVVESIVNPIDLSKYRLTVDYELDLDLIRRIYKAMDGQIWDSQAIIAHLKVQPALALINARYNKETGARPI